MEVISVGGGKFVVVGLGIGNWVVVVGEVTSGIVPMDGVASGRSVEVAKVFSGIEDSGDVFNRVLTGVTTCVVFSYKVVPLVILLL